MQYAIEIGSSYDFHVLQGSVEKYIRWRGESLWLVYNISWRICEWV